MEVKTTECLAEFDEIVVWGHDQVPGEDDEYARGMEEWIAFAEAVSSVDTSRLKCLLLIQKKNVDAFE